MERNISRDEMKLAEEEARQQGLSDEDLAEARLSPKAGLGGVIRLKIDQKGLSTEEFSEISGIPEDELRSIYLGLMNTDSLQDRFGVIADALEMDDEDIDKLESAFPFLHD